VGGRTSIFHIGTTLIKRDRERKKLLKMRETRKGLSMTEQEKKNHSHKQKKERRGGDYTGLGGVCEITGTGTGTPSI